MINHSLIKMLENPETYINFWMNHLGLLRIKGYPSPMTFYNCPNEKLYYKASNLGYLSQSSHMTL